MNFAGLYLDLILRERQWSWALVGIFYLLIALLVRILIFRGVIQETKRIDPQLYSGVKKAYLQHSAGGWIVFAISFLLVIAVWMGWKGPAIGRGVCGRSVRRAAGWS